MERLKFIGKRLIYLVVMLFGVATLVFILTKMIPGDPTGGRRRTRRQVAPRDTT